MLYLRKSSRPTRGHPRHRPCKYTVRKGRVRPVRPQKESRLLLVLAALRRLLRTARKKMLG